MKKSLLLTSGLKSGWINLGANLAMAAYQWGLLVILTRTLGQSDVGVFTYSIALLTPLSTWFHMQMRNRISADNRNWTDYEFMRARGLGIILLLACSPLLMFWQSSQDWLYATLPLCLVKVGELISDFSFAFDQRNENLVPTRKSQIIKALSALVVASLIAIKTNSLPAILWGNATCLLFVSIFLDARRVDWLSSFSKVNDSKWIKLVWQGLGLGIGALTVALHFNIPRYFVENFMGKEALARFSVLFQFYALAVLAINALIQPQLPRLARIKLQGKKEFSRELIRMLSLALAAAILAALSISLLGNFALNILYGDSYQASQEILNYVATTIFIGMIVQVSNYLLFSLARFKLHTFLSIGALGISSMTALLISNDSGFKGALMAFSAGLALQLFGAIFGCIFYRFPTNLEVSDLKY